MREPDTKSRKNQVSVKEGTTSYTYEPENITGFTYDNGNSNNILTTVVKGRQYSYG